MDRPARRPLSRPAVAGLLPLAVAAALAPGSLEASPPGAFPAPPAPSVRDAGADSVRVPILVYHSVAPHAADETPVERDLRVDPEHFEAQMEILRSEGIPVISLQRLVEALGGGDPLPPRSVVLTFDDGWANQYRHAFPVLQRHGFTATFFVFTNPIGRDARFMTWEQLGELVEAGMSIGSHSRTHPYLSRIESPTELRREVAGSRELLQERLGIDVPFFAYPFGEWSPVLEAAVREAGYDAARVFPGGAWHHPDAPFALRSIQVTDDLVRFRRLVGAAP